MAEKDEDNVEVAKKREFAGKLRVLREQEKLAGIAALENCIGRHGGNVLTKHKPFIRALESIAKRKPKREGEKDHECDGVKCFDEILGESAAQHKRGEEWHREENRRRIRLQIVTRAYLGRMARQHEFLNRLEAAFVGDGIDSELHDLVVQAQEEIKNQLAFLQKNRPLYHFQHKYNRCNKVRQKKKRQVLDKAEEIMEKEIERMFENLENFRKLRQTKKCIDEAHKIKRLLERTAPQMAEKKSRYGRKLANLMGLIYLDRKIFMPHLSEKDNRLRVACSLGLDPVYNRMKMDAITRSSDFPFFNNTSWRADYKQFLNVADSDDERAWLHHEIGWTYGREMKWEHLVAQGYKCAMCAKRCGNLAWEINGLFLVAMGATKRRDHDEAMEATEEIIAAAKKMNNDKTFECMLVAKEELAKHDSQIESIDTNALIKKREKQIEKLMQSDVMMQTKVRDLFSRIRALPPDRRLTMVPGTKPIDNRSITVQDRSIIPGGCGGRLGMHPVTERDFWEFIEFKKPTKI